MPPTNVEIVRRGFDAFESLDMEAFTGDWAPDVEWDVCGYQHWPGAHHVYHGAEEILLEFGRFLGNVRSLTLDGLEVIDLGGDRVLALYTEERSEHGAPDPERLDIGIVYTLDDGKVTRIEVHTSRAAARAAAAAGQSQR